MRSWKMAKNYTLVHTGWTAGDRKHARGLSYFLYKIGGDIALSDSPPLYSSWGDARRDADIVLNAADVGESVPILSVFRRSEVDTDIGSASEVARETFELLTEQTRLLGEIKKTVDSIGELRDRAQELTEEDSDGGV
jgi:hypothetical protein